MSERRRADRLDAIVQRLLKGKRAAVRPQDADDRDALLAAARLAAARESYPRMSSRFRRRLAAQLSKPSSERLTRRSALVAGVALAAGAVAGFEVPRLFEGASGRPAPAATTVNPRPGRWHDIGALAGLPEGQGVRVTAGAVGAFVFRQGNTVTAVSSICSHLPCALDWRAPERVLLCPCHNRTFSAEGESTDDAYPLPALPRVQARVVKGRVELLGT